MGISTSTYELFWGGGQNSTHNGYSCVCCWVPFPAGPLTLWTHLPQGWPSSRCDSARTPCLDCGSEQVAKGNKHWQISPLQLADEMTERASRGSVWGGASAGKLGGATEEGGVAREARTNQETGRAVRVSAT